MAKQKKSGIHIKASHEGRLHRATKTKQGDKIPLAKEEAAAHSKNPKVRKEAQFALNARKFNHSRKGK